MFDESVDTAWRLRYGSEPPDLPNLERFLAHRSIRQFETKPVSESIAAGLVAAAQSAATSSNLQLWSVVSVQNTTKREQFSELCGGQKHIVNCGWFFVFLADVHRVKEAAQAANEKADGLDYTEFFTMAVIDAAIAAERMVCAAESVGLGICYIGAVRNNPEEVKNLLKLPTGVFGAFGLCVGWPAEPLTSEIKPRLTQDSVWFKEEYCSDLKVEEYDERMKGFYASQNMKTEATWSMRSGRRVGTTQLTGREVLREWLQMQGFLHR